MVGISLNVVRGRQSGQSVRVRITTDCDDKSFDIYADTLLLSGSVGSSTMEFNIEPYQYLFEVYNTYLSTKNNAMKLLLLHKIKIASPIMLFVREVSDYDLCKTIYGDILGDTYNLKLTPLNDMFLSAMKYEMQINK